MARPVHTDDDKGRAVRALTANEGNVKRTSRELDIPEQTVRDWKKEMERGQLSPSVVEAVPAAIDATVNDFERMRDKALIALEEEIDGRTLKGRDYIVAA